VRRLRTFYLDVGRLRQSLTARTLAISAVFALLLAGGFFVLVVAIEQLRDAGRAAVRAQQAVTVGTELQKSVVNLENGLRGYVATGRVRLLDPFETARRQYPEEVRRLQALAEDDPALRAEVRQIAGEISDYVDLWAVPLLRVAEDDLEVARSVIVNETGRMRVERVRSGFRRMFARARAEAERREARAERRSRIAVGLGIAGMFLVLSISVAAAWLLRRIVLRPVQSVAQATETVAAGDLSTRVPADRQDEIGDLARAFNAMAASLERNRVELADRADDLERSNRELEDYASITSHDLQGPLVTVGMYAEMLTQRLHDDADARQLAENIRDGAAGMRRLVRELLAYARLERRAIEPEPVELGEAVREALENLAGPIADADADVRVEPLPTVMGDPARLVQLVQNLLTNAIKFTSDDPPRVEVSARRDGAMAIVSVRDHGIGLDPDKTEIIFRPFHRLHGADRYAGTGIGLAVCQKIVDQHGGRIWAESTPGHGATFNFTLRLADALRSGETPPERVIGGTPAFS
jgi:signal transduction histidine kinase